MAAIIKGNARQAGSAERVSEGADVFLRMMRDGSLVASNWKQAAIFQGLGFMVNVGAFSTPITGGGNGTIIDQDQPEFVVSVPNGTSIMPIRIEVSCLSPVLNLDSDEMEILIAVDQDTTGVTGATDTDETIYNMNTLCGRASACTATSATSGGISTEPVLDLELMHKIKVGDVAGSSTAQLWGELYGLYEPDAPPIINGPANLIGYFGGTVAVTGFAVVQWIEFPESYATI